jgi:hypothetical protein
VITVEGERGSLVGGLAPAHAAVAAVSRRRDGEEDQEEQDEGQGRGAPHDGGHGRPSSIEVGRRIELLVYLGEQSRTGGLEIGLLLPARTPALC